MKHVGRLAIGLAALALVAAACSNDSTTGGGGGDGGTGPVSSIGPGDG